MILPILKFYTGKTLMNTGEILDQGPPPDDVSGIRPFMDG